MIIFAKEITSLITNTQSKMKTANLSESVKYEWMCREEGSYEDNGKPENHIYAILERSPKGKVKANTLEEIAAIQKSAGYCSDFDGSPEAIRSSKSISRFINF